MKVTMELTLEGLLRALRARAHALADEIEAHVPGDPVERAAEVRRITEGERRAAHVPGN